MKCGTELEVEEDFNHIYFHTSVVPAAVCSAHARSCIVHCWSGAPAPACSLICNLYFLQFCTQFVAGDHTCGGGGGGGGGKRTRESPLLV